MSSVFFAVLVIAALLVGLRSVQADDSAEPLGTVHFLDVGQGDAALVSVGRNQVLIDGGPDESVLAELAQAMPLLDRRIEAVFLSHPDADHYRGLKAVIERYEVGRLMVGVGRPNAEYDDLIKRAAGRGIPIAAAAAGSVSLGPAVTLTTVYPRAPFPDGTTDRNNSSVIVRADLGPTSVLFPGDAEADQERRLVLDQLPVDVDVLKVGHHGSRTSSTPSFLAVVSPEISVISVGAKNRYGHPVRSVLEGLAAAGSRVYRTDRNGTVTLTATVRGYVIQAER